MEETNSIEIKRSIQQIYDILNHWTNLPQNGQPPYSPLPEESVQLLKEQLERLKKSLDENKEVQKDELKLAGLKEEDESYRLKPIQIGDNYQYLFWKPYKYPTEPIIRFEPKWLEPKWLEPILLEPILLEPILLEPILLEPILLEPKLLKTRPHKKSDGWRQANKNQRKPVCRY